MSYKVTIHIRGATTESIYGKNKDALVKRGIRRLTVWEPGVGSLYPKCICVFNQVMVVSGNRAQWEKIEEITYESIPQEDLVWLKRKLEMCGRKDKP